MRDDWLKQRAACLKLLRRWRKVRARPRVRASKSTNRHFMSAKCLPLLQAAAAHAKAHAHRGRSCAGPGTCGAIPGRAIFSLVTHVGLLCHSSRKKSGGPANAAVGLSHSRGPVYTGGRQVIRPGPEQSQLPRNCLRPPECNRITRRAAPAECLGNGSRHLAQGAASIEDRRAAGCGTFGDICIQNVAARVGTFGLLIFSECLLPNFCRALV